MPGGLWLRHPVLINDDFVENVTPGKVAELVRKYR